VINRIHQVRTTISKMDSSELIEITNPIQHLCNHTQLRSLNFVQECVRLHCSSSKMSSLVLYNVLSKEECCVDLPTVDVNFSCIETSDELTQYHQSSIHY
jgi:hypothetical protein